MAWEPTDRMTGLTLAAAGGLLAGAALVLFGLPPVDLHGPLHHLFGIMDPVCGGTRSVYYAMRGQWARSLEYNPIGVPLVIGAALLILRHAIGVATRRWLNPQVRIPNGAIVAAFAIGLIALEINQQLHAALLMGP